METEQLIQQWSEKVSQLQKEYSWLLFFSVPKLLLLYSLVDVQEPNIPAIVVEISFLFENTSEVREKVTTALKVRGTQTPEQCLLTASYYPIVYLTVTPSPLPFSRGQC